MNDTERLELIRTSIARLSIKMKQETSILLIYLIGITEIIVIILNELEYLTSFFTLIYILFITGAIIFFILDVIKQYKLINKITKKMEEEGADYLEDYLK